MRQEGERTGKDVKIEKIKEGKVLEDIERRKKIILKGEYKENKG